MTIDFDALYRAHYGRVFALCLKLLGSRPQAEDAAQEAFVRAYRCLNQYDTGQPFGRWVGGIAGNHCIDLIRRRAREPGLFADPAPEDGDAGSAGVLDALVDAEQETQLRDAVAALPDKYRVPIVLAYFNDWSYDRIAAELGITRNHVGVLLLRGKRALRRALPPSDPEPIP